MLISILEVKPMVASILKEFPHARDDDAFLFFMILKKYTDLEKQIGQENMDLLLAYLHIAHPFESYTRARRYIQNTRGLFQGTRQMARAAAEEEVRNHFAGGNHELD